MLISVNRDPYPITPVSTPNQTHATWTQNFFSQGVLSLSLSLSHRLLWLDCIFPFDYSYVFTIVIVILFLRSNNRLVCFHSKMSVSRCVCLYVCVSVCVYVCVCLCVRFNRLPTWPRLNLLLPALGLGLTLALSSLMRSLVSSFPLLTPSL